MWKFRIAMFAICAISIAGCSQDNATTVPDAGESAAANASAPDAEADSGSVTVKFQLSESDSAEVTVDNIREGDTVLSVLQKVTEPKLVIQGEGSSSLLIEVGDVAQDNSEGWTYTVNGEFADSGIGAFQVSPGDVIEWKFGGFNPE